MSLKQLLRRQVDVTGPSMLEATLKNEGVSPAEAKRRAGEVFGEILPTTHCLIDDASLWALKPLVMFAAAGLAGRGSGETWLAAAHGGDRQVSRPVTCGR